jgi:hypothetical protein
MLISMIGCRSCAQEILLGAGSRSTTNECVFSAGGNLRAARWTFAVSPEGNSSCAVPRWVVRPRRISGVMRPHRLLRIALKDVGVTIRLTNGNIAWLNQRCECSPVAYD